MDLTCPSLFSMNVTCFFFLQSMTDLAYQTLQSTIEQLRNERDDVRQRHIRAQIQIGELQKENMFLKEKIRSLELEIEIKLGLLFQVIIRIIIMQLDI
jgi:hypothetical protein